MTNLMQVTETAVVSMTSLEIVEFINSRRPEGSAELRHDSFMTKVPKVLGEGGVQNFLETHVHPQNGQTYPIYRFPKRESMLMAMSYDYAAQAAIGMSKFAHIYLVAKTPKTAYNSYVHKDSYQSG